MSKACGHKKRAHLERYLRYNQGYKRFLAKYADAVPGSDCYEEYQERKVNKNKVRRRIYEETATIFEQVQDPQARLMAELTFLEGFSIDEVASIFQLSEKRCTAILGGIYKDIQID